MQAKSREMQLRRSIALLNGAQTVGTGRTFWAGFAMVVLLAALLPVVADGFVANNIAYFLVWTFMALGLSLIWGYAGILSFGQTAFFGLAGYAYAVVTINAGDAHGLTWAALLVALAVSAVTAAVLGYFMFYGGVRDVFVGIVTLSVTLVFETFMAQTAGPEWAIGSARLNGFNGMNGMPSLTVPWPGQAIVLEGAPLFWFLLGLLVIVYLGLRMLVNSRFGNVLVAIRENPTRAEMLGYDIRRYQLSVFVIGSTLAGLSGVLYTTWGSYITPSSMGLNAAALPIIWVAAGGRKDLTASLVATLVLLWISQMLAVYGSQYALVLMGAILLLAVMVAPDGFVLAIANRLSNARQRHPSRKQPTGTAEQATASIKS